jgi:MoaA/NifB/PqqE/SkfB family radical SAM enzyme
MVNVTNACNLKCEHCFVFRPDNPNSPRDKMDDATMLAELERLQRRHQIQDMTWMGGEPLIRRDLLRQGVRLFPRNSIVTNGTFPLLHDVPNTIYVVSLDGPEEVNDSIRGEGVFQQVKQTIHDLPPDFGPHVVLQCIVTRANADHLAELVEQVRDWPVYGLSFAFYVPTRNDRNRHVWATNEERDPVVASVLELKRGDPGFVKNTVASLELMHSSVCKQVTDRCLLRENLLVLYLGEGGRFEQPYCCYGNDVDCDRCGAWAVFHVAATLGQRGQASEITPAEWFEVPGQAPEPGAGSKRSS